LFEAIGANEEDNLCRIIKSVEVALSNSVAFSPELSEEDCDGKLIYWANILDANPDDFEFIWYDQNLDSIGQGQFFEPGFFGEFFLEVKPIGSLRCPDPFISFIIEEPVTSVDLEIIGGFICEDPGFTLLSLNTDEALIDKIVWYYLDPNGNKLELPQFENELVIAIEEERVYEVEAMNHLGCILAQDGILIFKSVDDARPITEEEYVICLFYEVAEVIDPGDFEFYEWILEGERVYSERLFQPEREGQYTLTVTSIEGCQYTTEFKVIENCKFQVVYPNAIQPLNDDKNFMVYSNYLVNELSIWIYNKWGQLLFYCKDTDLTDRKASCLWDGTYNGEKLPTGSYILKIQYKNQSDETYQNISNSIFIVD